MKIRVDFEELSEQRERIGASLSNWDLKSESLDPRAKLLADLQQGIAIELKDIERGPGGLLTHKGEQVLLYIKDTRSDLHTLLHEPEKTRRFHVAECRTLERMRHEGRFERYVVTNRTDGKFLVEAFDPLTKSRDEVEAELKVCKDCLKALNWRGYQRAPDRPTKPTGTRQTKTDIWKQFSITDFMMDYATFFRSKPSRRDTEAEIHAYVADWPRISEGLRRQRNWTCEACGVNLSEHPRLLHCHHKSGVVTDNRPSNLMVLCALDHAAQPGHLHMRVPSQDRRVIQAARARQGISVR